MIRAVVSQGMFKPIDPVPAEWSDGAEVVVARVATVAPDVAEIDRWYDAYSAIACAALSPEETARLDAALADLKANDIAHFGTIAELPH